MTCKGCNQKGNPLSGTGDYYMAERIHVELPVSEYVTRLELYHGDPDVPERSSEQWPGTESIKVKLPDHVPLEECLIVVKTIGNDGQEIGNPYQWKDGKLGPYNPETDRWTPKEPAGKRVYVKDEEGLPAPTYVESDAEPAPETVVEPSPETVVEPAPETVVEPETTLWTTKQFSPDEVIVHEGSPRAYVADTPAPGEVLDYEPEVDEPVDELTAMEQIAEETRAFYDMEERPYMAPEKKVMFPSPEPDVKYGLKELQEDVKDDEPENDEPERPQPSDE